jgi:hypothetical protein
MAEFWFVLLLITDRLSPFSWFIVVAGLLAWKLKPNQVFSASIVLGMIHDVIWVEDFGWMSLGLVVLSGITLLSRSKLGNSAFWLWLAMLGVYQFGYSLLLHQRMPWVLAIVQMLVGVVLWRLVTHSKRSSEVYLQ